MQEQHTRHIHTTLETMDEQLEQYETRLSKKKNTKNLVRIIKDIRKDIEKIMSGLGLERSEKDVYSELYTSCSFFELYLTELEPDRFQGAYGKLDSKKEEKEIDSMVSLLKRDMEKLRTELDNIDKGRSNE